ncbi:MAG: thioredoxin domain-containing protein [bacterium]
MKKKLRMIVLGALTALALGVTPGPSAHAGGRGKPHMGRTKQRKDVRPTLGNRKARVTVEIFGDLQCPFTKRMLQSVIPQLVRAYPKKVKVVWRDMPLGFHRQAMPAAIAAREVFRQLGSKGFWAFQAKVFAGVQQIDDANLALWAGQVGADGAKVTSALQSRRHKAAVKADVVEAQRRGVRGTPSSFVNGQKLVGSQPLHKFRQLIDAL